MPQYWEDFTDIADINAFRLSSLLARDQYRLDVYECGSGTPCLLVSPPGSPFVVLSRLALELARNHRVIGWETRGSPYISQQPGQYSFTMEDYALDIDEILRARNIRKANVITWCESFSLLPYLQKLCSLEIDLVVNISPSLSYKRYKSAVSLSNEAFLASMTSIDASAAREAFDRFRLLRNVAVANLTEKEKIIARLLSLPLRTFEGAVQFANIARLFQERADIRKTMKAANATRPLFIHCQDDRIVNYKATIAFFGALKCGKLVLNKTGGHSYLFHQAADIAKEIDAFFS